MLESPSLPSKPSTNGIQGLTLMAPQCLPSGLDALSGALIIGAGIVPIALPAALPVLFILASRGEFSDFLKQTLNLEMTLEEFGKMVFIQGFAA